MVVALWQFLERTRLGLVIRATAQNAEMVHALGGDVGWVRSGVFGLGCGLAALGGVLAVPLVTAYLGLGASVVVDAFVIVIIGGMMTVAQGEILAVIGPNGAGKSTLFNVTGGVLRPTAGTVAFKGEDLAGLPPHAICARGVSRTFQLTALFPRLSALENVRLAAQARARGRWRFVGGGTTRAETAREAERWLDRLRLAHVAHAPAGVLSHGDQRLLEVAMALAIHKSNVWSELHGWSPRYLAPDLKAEIARRLQDRVMFGADYPLLSYKRLIADWQAEGYTDEVLDKGFRRNAEAFLATVRH